jgi:hypothetical protein
MANRRQPRTDGKAPDVARFMAAEAALRRLDVAGWTERTSRRHETPSLVDIVKADGFHGELMRRIFG